MFSTERYLKRFVVFKIHIFSFLGVYRYYGFAKDISHVLPLKEKGGNLN